MPSLAIHSVNSYEIKQIAPAAKAQNAPPTSIHTINSLAEIPLDQPERTLFLIDIDDTLIDSFSMLGSRAWRKYVRPALEKLEPGKNWHDILTLKLLVNKYPVVAVEGETTRSFINAVQQKGYVASGLTSRERSCWYDTPQEGVDASTIEQLNRAGIDLNDQSLEQIYPYLSIDNDCYYQGVFFADVEPKGDYLDKLFSTAPQFDGKVVVIDDKESQTASTDDALTKLNIPHECYTYTATQAKPFNPLYANIELYYFYKSDGKEILTDEEAKAIAEADPTKDADYYLKASLELAN